MGGWGVGGDWKQQGGVECSFDTQRGYEVEGEVPKLLFILQETS